MKKLLILLIVITGSIHAGEVALHNQTRATPTLENLSAHSKLRCLAGAACATCGAAALSGAGVLASAIAYSNNEELLWLGIIYGSAITVGASALSAYLGKQTYNHHKEMQRIRTQLEILQTP